MPNKIGYWLYWNRWGILLRALWWTLIMPFQAVKVQIKERLFNPMPYVPYDPGLFYWLACMIYIWGEVKNSWGRNER